MPDASVPVNGRAGPNYLAIVGMCFLVALLEGFDIQAAGVAGPLLVSEFGLDPSQAGLVFGAGMGGLVAGAAVGGWLAQRLGRDVLLTVAVLVFGAATASMVMAQGFVSLLLIRIVIGLGLGAAMPNLIAVAVETSPAELRTRTVTMMFCGMPVGGACSAAMAGLTMDEYGWRPLFVVGGLLPILVAPGLWRIIPKRGTGAAAAEPALGAAQALFGGGRTAPTILVWLAFFVTLMILYLMLNWLPLLVVGKNLSAATGSAAAFWFNAASVFGALGFGYLVDKHGAVWPIGVAYAGVVAAMSALAYAATAAAVVVASAAVGICLLGAQYSLYGIAPMFYPPNGRDIGIGASIAVGRLGSIAGPIAAGELLALGLSAGAVAFTAAPVAVIAGAAAIFASIVAASHER